MLCFWNRLLNCFCIILLSFLQNNVDAIVLAVHHYQIVCPFYSLNRQNKTNYKKKYFVDSWLTRKEHFIYFIQLIINRMKLNYIDSYNASIKLLNAMRGNHMFLPNLRIKKKILHTNCFLRNENNKIN